MGTVGIGLTNSLDSLLQRFPVLLDLAAGRARRSQPQVSPAALATIIETQIIPRLMVAHMPVESLGAAQPVAEGNWMPGEADVIRFAGEVLKRETSELLDLVEVQLAEGRSAETLLIHLLAPTARLLGGYWEDDRCDFVDVTMGLWRLQELTHVLAGRMRQPSATTRTWRGLFGSLPGDQHRLGSQMVLEFFRNAGWEVQSVEADSSEAFLDIVAAAPFDLVGLSINQDSQVEALVPLVEAVRARSVNPDVLLMVGGAILRDRPELAFLIGADATAADAPTAVLRAQSILHARGLAGVPPG